MPSRVARCHNGRVYRLQAFRTTFTTRANGVGREKQGPFLENETNSALTKSVLHLRADNRPRCTGRRSRGRRGKKAFLGQSIGFPQHAIAVEARAARHGVALEYYYIDGMYVGTLLTSNCLLRVSLHFYIYMYYVIFTMYAGF